MNYFELNQKLFNNFFNDDNDGKSVIIYVDENILDELNDASDFIKCIRQISEKNICKEIKNISEGWCKDKSIEEPPFFAFLCFLILVFTHKDLNKHKKTAFYPRLEQLLNLRITSAQMSSNEIDKLWKDLDSWTKATKDKELGYYDFKISGSKTFKHMGPPLTQALINSKDRINIERKFVELGYTPSKKLQTQNFVDQHLHNCLNSSSSRRKFESREDYEKIAYEQIIESIFESWDGSYIEQDENEKHKVSCFKLLLALAGDDLEGYNLVSYLESYNEDFPDEEIQLKLKNNKDELKKTIYANRLKFGFSKILKTNEENWNPICLLNQKYNLFHSKQKLFCNESIYFFKTNHYQFAKPIQTTFIDYKQRLFILIKENEHVNFLERNEGCLEKEDFNEDNWFLYSANNLKYIPTEFLSKNKDDLINIDLINGLKIKKNQFISYEPPTIYSTNENKIISLKTSNKNYALNQIGDYLKLPDNIPTGKKLSIYPASNIKHLTLITPKDIHPQSKEIIDTEDENKYLYPNEIPTFEFYDSEAIQLPPIYISERGNDCYSFQETLLFKLDKEIDGIDLKIKNEKIIPVEGEYYAISNDKANDYKIDIFWLNCLISTYYFTILPKFLIKPDNSLFIKETWFCDKKTINNWIVETNTNERLTVKIFGDDLYTEIRNKNRIPLNPELFEKKVIKIEARYRKQSIYKQTFKLSYLPEVLIGNTTNEKSLVSIDDDITNIKTRQINQKLPSIKIENADKYDVKINDQSLIETKKSDIFHFPPDLESEKIHLLKVYLNENCLINKKIFITRTSCEFHFSGGIKVQKLVYFNLAAFKKMPLSFKIEHKYDEEIQIFVNNKLVNKNNDEKYLIPNNIKSHVIKIEAKVAGNTVSERSIHQVINPIFIGNNPSEFRDAIKSYDNEEKLSKPAFKANWIIDAKYNSSKSHNQKTIKLSESKAYKIKETFFSQYQYKEKNDFDRYPGQFPRRVKKWAEFCDSVSWAYQKEEWNKFYLNAKNQFINNICTKQNIKIKKHNEWKQLLKNAKNFFQNKPLQ